MSKTKKNPQPVTTQKQLYDSVMNAVESGKVEIKPKWQLILASVASFVGLIGVTISSAFLFTVTIFLLRSHGPMGSWRLQQMLLSFPWWIPVLGLLCLSIGFILLRHYDFSYKKNFPVIIAIFVAVVIVSAVLIDRMGINETWSRGPMRRWYQQNTFEDTSFPQRERGNRFNRLDL